MNCARFLILQIQQNPYLALLLSKKIGWRIFFGKKQCKSKMLIIPSTAGVNTFFFAKNQGAEIFSNPYFRREGGGGKNAPCLLFQFCMFQRKNSHHRSFKRNFFRFCRRKVMIFNTNFRKFLKTSKIIESNFPLFLKKTITPRGLMDFFGVSQA